MSSDIGGMALLEAGAESLGITLTKPQLGQFREYQEMLIAWNKSISLTSLAEPAGIQRGHFLDSLSCARVTGDLSSQTLVDVGSGAGFPGLPLKILYPACRLALVESVAKKAAFIEAVVAKLGLEDVAVYIARAEELGRDTTHREHYDWALARAVAPLPVLVEYLLPLVRQGGRALAQKGPKGPDEVALAQTAIAKLGGGRTEIQNVTWDAGPGERYLVIIDKVAPTPASYPRRAGMAAKRPIGDR